MEGVIDLRALPPGLALRLRRQVAPPEGRTQVQLGQLAGLSASQVCMAETGRTTMSLEALEAIRGRLDAALTKLEGSRAASVLPATVDAGRAA